MKVAYLTAHTSHLQYESPEALMYISDRRRSAGWASNRGHSIVTGPKCDVDAAVFGALSDFRLLERFKSKWKVLDLVDGYLALNENLIIDNLRGIRRQDRWLYSLRFSERLKHACSVVDCVVTGSPEQATLVSRYNKNVHIILDNQSEFGTQKSMKLDNNSREKTFLWEGLSSNIFHLLTISNVLDKHLEKTNSTLVVLSNKRVIRNKYFQRSQSTEELLMSKFPQSRERIQFYPWSVEAMLRESKRADCAIIPINIEDRFAMLKPENKLLIMLSLGLPTLVSAIYSYSRVLHSLSLNQFLVGKGQWLEKLNHLDEMLGVGIDVSKVNQYLSRQLDAERLNTLWDRAFNL